MQRAVIGLAALLLAGGWAASLAASTARQGSAQNPLIGDEIGLDHVLLWSGDRQAAEAAIEKLGFSLSPKPGSYGAGISNRLVWFRNWSFVEFLWLSDPAQAKREAPKEHAFVSSTNGSNGYGISVRDADETYKVLAAAELQPDQPGAEAYDPDGPEGPKPPVVDQWRFMFLKEGALAGNPFFVEYRTKASADRKERHANGAIRLSAVWVVVSDVGAAEAAYGRAQFRRTKQILLPKPGLQGVALGAGQGEVLLLQPVSGSPFRLQLRRRGDHVAGISVEVTDLDATELLLEDRLGVDLRRHAGRFGQSLLAPQSPALGLTVEFHE